MRQWNLHLFYSLYIGFHLLLIHSPSQWFSLYKNPMSPIPMQYLNVELPRHLTNS